MCSYECCLCAPTLATVPIIQNTSVLAALPGFVVRSVTLLPLTLLEKDPKPEMNMTTQGQPVTAGVARQCDFANRLPKGHELQHSQTRCCATARHRPHTECWGKPICTLFCESGTVITCMGTLAKPSRSWPLEEHAPSRCPLADHVQAGSQF